MGSGRLWERNFCLLSKLCIALFLLAGADKGQAAHYVVLVPGIGCTYQGCMAPLASEIKKDLLLKKVKEDIRILDFHYPLAPQELDTYALAKSLGLFLDKTFGGDGSQQKLSSQDVISLVGYSQGGLVSLLWLQHAYRKHEEYFPKYLPWVRHFVSLGTPFWGTEVAHAGSVVKRSPIEPLAGALPFSAVQLNDMSSLSHMMFRFRTKATSKEFRDLNRSIFSSVRTLAVAGSIGKLPERFQLMGVRTLDTDLTVPLPSAHPNMIFGEVDLAQHKGSIEEWQFSKSHLVPVKVLQAVHAAVPGLSIPAIHELGSGSGKVIVDHLLGRTHSENLDSDLGEAHRVQIQVMIQIPKSTNVDEREVRLKFLRPWFSRFKQNQDNQTISMDPLSLSLLASGDIRANAVREYRGMNQFHFTATGALKDVRKATVALTLKVPGQKERILRLPVEAGMTTYLHLRN